MTNDEVTSAHNGTETDKKDIIDWNSKHSVKDCNINEAEKQHHGETNRLPDLQRKLKSRHLQMIAMGKSSGCIPSQQ